MGTIFNIKKSPCYSHSMNPLPFLMKGGKDISNNQKKNDSKGSAGWQGSKWGEIKQKWGADTFLPTVLRFANVCRKLSQNLLLLTSSFKVVYFHMKYCMLFSIIPKMFFFYLFQKTVRRLSEVEMLDTFFLTERDSQHSKYDSLWEKEILKILKTNMSIHQTTTIVKPTLI